VEVLDTFWWRARGLLGRASLPRDRAVVLPGCGSIHTFGMRFILDVIFFDTSGRVVRADFGVRPWRILRGGRNAKSVLEAASGRLLPSALQPGVRLRWLSESDDHASGIPI